MYYNCDYHFGKMIVSENVGLTDLCVCACMCLYVCVCVCMYVCVCKRERERESERARGRERGRERELPVGGRCRLYLGTVVCQHVPHRMLLNLPVGHASCL